MRTIVCFFGLLCLSVSATAQNYAIGHVALTFTDASRNNRNIPVEIYYPAEQAGDDVALADDSQFPSIAFGHGFVIGFDAYENIREMLVPNGFIMIFPKTEDGILPSHLEFGKDLAFCIGRMKQLGLDPDSIFFGRISDKSALMGHSMGGGAAFLGMQQNPEISALAVLAPAETNPSAIEAASTLTIPALVIAGGNDCVTPPTENQVPMYNALSGMCKTYLNIIGASHCQMANFNFLCQIGELTCSPSPSISRDVQHSVIAAYLVPWMQANLMQDCEAGASFNDLIASDDAVSYERTCEQCEELAVADANRLQFKLSPNPFSDIVNIEMEGESVFELFDASGRRLTSTKIRSGNLNLDFLAQGIYTYRIATESSVQTGKLVRK